MHFNSGLAAELSSSSSPVRVVQRLWLHRHLMMPAVISLPASYLPILKLLQHPTDRCQLAQPAICSQEVALHGVTVLQGCLRGAAPQSKDSSSLDQQLSSIQDPSAGIAMQPKIHQGEPTAGLKTCFIAVLSPAVGRHLTMQAVALQCLLPNPYRLHSKP